MARPLRFRERGSDGRASANGFPAGAVLPFLDALARFLERRQVRTFLATVDSMPAATSTLLGWAGVAGLYNVGTLHASVMGEPIYRAVGFQKRCRFNYAVRSGHSRRAVRGHAVCMDDEELPPMKRLRARNCPDCAADPAKELSITARRLDTRARKVGRE